MKLQIPESKFYDGSSTGNNVAATWGYTSFLKSIIQGAALGTIPTANFRIGNKIFVKFIEVVIQMNPTVTAAQTTGAGCRTAIIHVREANGTTPVGTDVFLSNAITSLRNSTKLPAYGVLRDSVDVFVPTAATAANTVVAVAPLIVKRMRIPVNKTISYSGSNGTSADLLTDDYGLMCIANTATTCTMDVYWKVVFTDS